MKDQTRPIRRVYNDVITSVDDPDLPEFINVRSSLQRARATQMPPIPQSIEDISILGDWAKTWGGEQFVLNQDNDWGHLHFVTKI